MRSGIIGRPRLPRIEGYREVLRDWEEKKITGKAAAEKPGCSRACLYKWARQERKHEDAPQPSVKREASPARYCAA